MSIVEILFVSLFCIPFAATAGAVAAIAGAHRLRVNEGGSYMGGNIAPDFPPRFVTELPLGKLFNAGEVETALEWLVFIGDNFGHDDGEDLVNTDVFKDFIEVCTEASMHVKDKVNG